MLRPLISKFLMLCVALAILAGVSVSADRLNLRDPIRLPDGEVLKSIYFFGHWWDPWKSDDDAISTDLKRLKELGFNTICVDHEVSQAIDREWYWLDREYELAAQEGMYVLPWLQLQSVDRLNLMKFSHLELKHAVNQDKQPEEGCVTFMDGEFKRALAHYISVYLDRYESDPALLRIKHGREFRPVVGLCVETGWRTDEGLPLSFDEEANAYFRKWMRATYYDINHLNSKWGTSYSSFDEIDPCDKSVFNYDLEDKRNMPAAVREHVNYRARFINDALQDVARRVRKKHKDVLFLAEVAYPFSVDNPDADIYRWSSPNVYRIVDHADLVMVRTVGNTSAADVKKEQDLLMLRGKKLILAYRFFEDSTSERAVSFAADCAASANGLGYYNWNETEDSASAIYDKPDRQAFARLMTATYDVLYDANKRHELQAIAPLTPPSAIEPTEAAGESAEPATPTEEAPAPEAEEVPAVSVPSPPADAPALSPPSEPATTN